MRAGRHGAPGYRLPMGVDDLLTYLGDHRVHRSDVPAELEPYVDEAFDRGLALQDCRDLLVRLD